MLGTIPIQSVISLQIAPSASSSASGVYFMYFDELWLLPTRRLDDER